jgi:hypothetical protein
MEKVVCMHRIHVVLVELNVVGGVDTDGAPDRLSYLCRVGNKGKKATDRNVGTKKIRTCTY